MRLKSVVILMFIGVYACQSIESPSVVLEESPEALIDAIPETQLDLSETSESIVDIYRNEHLVAFPGAEGFGANTAGGRGGEVIEVLNLNDSGPGSLRHALEVSHPRIVVFKVGGIITLKSSLVISNPYITIAGQTSPGGGITLRNDPSHKGTALIVNTHDVIIRYIRVRPGAPSSLSHDSSGIGLFGNNIILDHCSVSWATDQVVFTWYGAHDITIQWSIISEGLNCSTHDKGCHSTGLLLGSNGSKNISVHHNLLAHNVDRNPLIKTSGLVDFVNNVVYNFVYTPINVTDEYGTALANIIGNYFKPGKNTVKQEFFIGVLKPDTSYAKLYIQGNMNSKFSDSFFDDHSLVKPDSRRLIVDSKFDSPAITTSTAIQAYRQVLSLAGATLPTRDGVDHRIVNDVLVGHGEIVDSPTEVGGWPVVDTGDAPIDIDHDGMPDIWEIKYGFDPNDYSNATLDADKDGYSNIEEYLNSTTPVFLK